jgi:predicted negative regulator of RcsB-dependent stress response
VDKLTRKELKSDKFALEVQHSVEYVSVHRRQMIRWAVPAAVVILIAIGVFWYRNYQHGVRQEALHSTMQIQNSTIGPSQSEYVVSFPTAEARKTAVVKAWSDLAVKYSGTEEGGIAEFFLGTNAADVGNLPEAVKHFHVAIDTGSAPYASASKLALADLIKTSDPQRARKLVDPLRTSTRSAVSKAAITLASSLPQK